MIELESAVFLQNQKTGSTFVEQFLRANSDETIIAYPPHKAPGLLRKGKMHFAGVREPLDLYLSLYNYGLDGGGYIHYKLGKKGLGGFYDEGIDGFDRWLRFVLSDDFKTVFRQFDPYSHEMGLCTWRFLRLARLNFNRRKSMLDSVLKFERLNEDLQALARTKLAPTLRDVDVACDWIDGRARINASNRRDRTHDVKLSRETLSLLLAKERRLYDAFYPERAEVLRRKLKWPRWGRSIRLAEIAD